MSPLSPRVVPRAGSRWKRPGCCDAVLRGHTDRVNGARVLSDGRILSWSDDKTLRLWRSDGAPDGEPLRGHDDRVVGAQELPAGRILSWSDDKTLRLWRPDGAPATKPLRGHTGRIYEAFVLPGGGILSWGEGISIALQERWRNDDRHLSRSVIDVWHWRSDGTAEMEPLSERQFDIVERHFEAWRHDLRISGKVGSIVWLSRPDGTVIRDASRASGGVSSDIDRTIWLTQPDGTACELRGHEDKVVGWTRLSSNRILSWSQDHTLRIWNLDRAPKTGAGRGHYAEKATRLSSDNLLSWGGDTLQLWHSDGTPLGNPLHPETITIRGAIALPNDGFLSWGYANFWLWQADGKEPIAGPIHAHFQMDGALPLDDGRIATWGHFDSQLEVWLPNGARSGTLPLHGGGILKAIRLADGQILSWGKDNCVRAWHLDGTPAAEPMRHEDEITCAVRLVDGRFLSFTKSGAVRRWRADGKPDGHSYGEAAGRIFDATILSDGRVLSWGVDRALRIWAADGSPEGQPMRLHRDAVRGVTELPEGRIVSFDSRMVRIWKPDKSSSVSSFLVDAEILLCDGKTAVAARDGRLVVYDLHLD